MKSVICSLLVAVFIFVAGCAGKKEPVFERKVTIGSNSATTPVPRPANTGSPFIDWWMPRHTAVVERVKHGNVDLIMIGDSITHGWDNAGKKTWDKYYGDHNAVNMGFSADQTGHVLWRLENGEISGISPKLAIVMIGTNNSNSDSPDQIADGVAAILQKIRTDLPKTKILLLAIFPRADRPAQEPIVEQANAIIKNFADNKHIFFLDINRIWLTPDGKVNKNLMPDLLHPNAEGYKLWAEAMEPMVEKLMTSKN